MKTNTINGSTVTNTVPYSDIGLCLAWTEDGRLYDIEGNEPVELTPDALDDVRANVESWLESDLSGSRLADWESVVEEVLSVNQQWT